MKTHKTNLEELINAFRVVEVDVDTARCTTVNELELCHLVQYIQINRRNEHTHTLPASVVVYASRRELEVIITETHRYVQEVHA